MVIYRIDPLRRQPCKTAVIEIIIFLCEIGLMRQGWKFLASPTAIMRNRKTPQNKSIGICQRFARFVRPYSSIFQISL